MIYLVIGIILSYNIIVLIWKIRRPTRRLDGLVDTILVVLVAMLFSGSTELLIIGTIGSAVISTYLLIFPIRANYAKA